MITRRTAIAALLSVSMLPAISMHAQETATAIDYKTVIADYMEATGGEMAYDEIKTIAVKGKMAILEMGIEGEMSMVQNADATYSKVVMGGIGEEISGRNGDVVWKISGMTGPEILEGDQRELMMRQYDLNPYKDLEDKYSKVECTGVEKFNDEECHVVVMTIEGQEPIYQYFSVESKLLVGNKMTITGPMGEMELVSEMSDYKDVGDIKMSHKTTVRLPQGMTMETTIESIEVNGEIDEALLALPEEIKELVEDE